MKDEKTIEILKETFNNLPLGVGIFHVPDLSDIQSIEYVFMNKVILYEMRKTKEEVFGKRIIEVAPEAFEHEGGLMVLETYRKVAEEGGSINLGLVEYSNHMVAGTYECSVHSIAQNYVYVMLRNVTELEQTKNDLEQKIKELNQFVYMVSHDLKEPLRTISTYIQLIRDAYNQKFDEKAKKMFGFISNSASRMTQLITDLLDLSKIGQVKELSKVKVEELLQEIKQDLAEKIKASKAEITIGDMPEILAHRTEMRLLFQNLINNAIKFIEPGKIPQIAISAEQKEGWTFTVQDNGLGIAEENKAQIFQAFERLHNNTAYEGSGIGLAHCQKIIDLHKGRIWIESELGKGSAFHFTIPQKAN